MKISIITTTYNSEATVRDTLICVRNQSYKDVEHLIIDGASTDDTLRILTTFPHIAKTVSEKDTGLYDAMNKGLAAATGEVIGILNSDDVYTNKQVLQKVAAIFEDDSIDICYADLQYVDAEDLDKVIRTWKSGIYTGPKAFYWGWMPPHPTVFVRRRVYNVVGNFNTSLRSAADYELMLRIFVKHRFKVAYLPEIIVKMRAGGTSNATIKNRLKANREDLKAWQLNGLSPYFFTLFLKPLRKVSQFIIR